MVYLRAEGREERGGVSANGGEGRLEGDEERKEKGNWSGYLIVLRDSMIPP